MSDRSIPEVWGGVECTVNRVEDRWMNQCRQNGHDRRPEDLKKFASLGISRIRYPFLWELADPEGSGKYDWTWADERVAALKSAGLKPIAGLLHHGSGPPGTSLVDPEFPEKFGRYVRAFAERFPELDEYTPINEPLTTARFSALYGVWYPHARSPQQFILAILNQVLATRVAMKEIRRVNPAARLIQTEDIGRVRSTPPIAYQAEFENERRWLTFDLLCGKITKKHPLYAYLIKNGAEASTLSSLVSDPCPPDVLGLNHYPLSNRYLDHRTANYPPEFRGGNGRHRYADVGAIDVRHLELLGPKEVFRDAAERYDRPIAITEVHSRGGRETQLRWFHEVWEAACELREEGHDIQAVTAWSLLGSYDWNSLCTRENGFYESGVFDLSSGEPRETALAGFVRRLARMKERSDRWNHPLASKPGWWHFRELAMFGTIDSRGPSIQTDEEARLLLIAPPGFSGESFGAVCTRRRIPWMTCETGRIKEISDQLDPRRYWGAVLAVEDMDTESIQEIFRERNIGIVRVPCEYAENEMETAIDSLIDAYERDETAEIREEERG